MTTAEPCTELRSRFGDLFECKLIRDFFRIRTPFHYPDGGIIDLYLEDDGSALTDFGETLRWLRMNNYATSRTKHQDDYIKKICKSRGANLLNGQIRKSIFAGNLALTVAELSETCMRVADVSMTFRGRSVSSVIDEVEEFLNENSFDTERNKQVTGVSGKNLYIDLTARHKDAFQSSFIKVLTSTSKSQTTRIIDHALRTWVDLKPNHSHFNFVTLVDDTVSGIWDQGEIGLLDEHSKIANWSTRGELITALTG